MRSSHPRQVPPGSGPPGATPLHGPASTQNPQAVYARLRAQWGPLAPVELEPGIEAWLVLGYDKLLTISRNDELFSRDSRHWRAHREGRLPTDSPLVPITGWRPTLLNLDGGEHYRLRKVVLDLLGRVDRRQLLNSVTQTADTLIDGRARTSRGSRPRG